MDEDSPVAQGSPPIPKKGAYSIDFDSLDEFSNPFESKTKLTMGSSPPVKSNTFQFDENADPFESKKSLANSPPGSPKMVSKNTDDISGAPDHTADDIIDSGQNGDAPFQAQDATPDGASVVEEKSAQVTPKKKKVLKKPQVQSKFKPPKNMKRNKNMGGDIEILMPGVECENNNGSILNADDGTVGGQPPLNEAIDHFHPVVPAETADGDKRLLNEMKEDGPPPLDAAPEAMAMSSSHIDRHFIDKDDDQDDQFGDGSEFKDARDWSLSNNMNAGGDTSPSSSERSNRGTSSSNTETDSSKSENEVAKPSGSEPIREKHPAARALQAAQVEDPVVFSGKYESSSEEGPFYDAIDYGLPTSKASGCVGKQQMSGGDKKGDMDSSENKGTVVQLVQVLRYSQTDWNKLKQELELTFQTSLLNKERDWSRLLADRDKKISNLEESNKKLKATKEDMRAVVTEFEKTMAQLQSEKEKMKNESGKKVTDLESERDQALEDLSSVENAFSDLHRRYEKSKTVIEGFKRNEEELKECMEDLKQKLKKSESKLMSLRSQAEEKLDRANEDIDKIKKSTKGEVARLEAALKKSELRISSLDEALSRKEKENQELTAICDELIAKVGS